MYAMIDTVIIWRNLFQGMFDFLVGSACDAFMEAADKDGMLEECFEVAIHGKFRK